MSALVLPHDPPAQPPCCLTQVQTTARYAHLARDTVKASAARIGDSIERNPEVGE